ncbi:unnamed protein product, partial [Pylaiella littoralis]
DWHLGYPDCAGTRQSPINIAVPSITAVSVSPFSLSFSSATCAGNEMSFKGDGAVWQVGFEGCTTQPSLTYEGQVYNLLQFHIHSPSEYEIGGAEYSAGFHFVHVKAGTTSDLLVVGVAFDITTHSTNPELQKYWDVLETGASNTTDTFTACPYDLLSLNPGFTHFMGSLTTPPCTEGVEWIFMNNPSYMSETQLNLYRTSVATFPGSKVSEQGNTNRPVQPVNDRALTYVVL